MSYCIVLSLVSKSIKVLITMYKCILDGLLGCLLAVPSAAPTSVKVSAVTFINFTVRWGGVKCAHRNGDITGYTVVIKEELGLMRMLRQDTSSNVYEETFTERKVSTNYSIRVAAINSAGVGVYSDAIYVKTKG